jgi:aryl-alcohol dehydrogenase-like predicted oxidoreductase
METRTLGNSDLHITPIGFGAWAIGGNWKFGWGAQDDAASIAAIHQALELGITWIDTAAAYGLGHSEKIVAKALADWPHERPLVFTKCGIVWNQKGEVDYSLKPDSIRTEVENSLRRLRVETIDLCQIHWPVDDLSETVKGWQTLAQLQKEGKVRWTGVSNFSVPEIQAAQQIAPVTSLQPPYSLVKRETENELLPFCRQQNIGVIVYSPMGSGLLTGAMTRDRVRSLPPGDWRNGNPEFQEPKLTQNLALVERLRAVGARHGRTPGEVATAWTLRQPAVTAAIVGARHPDRLSGIIGATDFGLSPAEIVELEGAPEKRPSALHA